MVSSQWIALSELDYGQSTGRDDAFSPPAQRAPILAPDLGPRVSIVDNQGKLVSRIGDPFAGRAPTSSIGPHGLTVDSHGDLYVAEVCWTLWPGLFPDEPRPDNMRTIQEYQRVH